MRAPSSGPLLLAFLLAVPACGAAGPSGPAPAAPPSPPSDFETRLALKDAAGKETTAIPAGAPITLVVTVRNRADAPRTLTLPTSQTHDCIVFADEREVWRWSAGRVFAQVLTELTLAPGETRAFSVAWSARDRAGAPLPAGRYRAVGLVPAEGPGLRSAPLAFEVR
jgi:hypothetical protein